MNNQELKKHIEQCNRKAESKPFTMVKISHRNFVIYNSKANISFSISYNPDALKGERWYLIDLSTNETIDAYAQKCECQNVVNNWI